MNNRELSRILSLLGGFLIGAAIAFISGTAHAGYAQFVPSAGVAKSGSSYVTTSAQNFSGASFNSSFKSNVGGTPVTIPASYRVAANAASFAVSAVRATPATLVGGAIIDWLANGGIEWIDGQFKSPRQTETWTIQGCNLATGCGMPVFPTAQDAANYACTNVYSGGIKRFTPSPGFAYYECNGGGGNRTNRVGQGSDPQPVTDKQWEDLSNKPLPDAVAGRLSELGLPVPLELPKLQPDPVTIPIGSPWYDPVTKTWQQPMATFTPGTNPDRVPYTIYNQQVDPNGKPVLDPNGQPINTKPDPSQDPQVSVSDTPLPELPKLYERKYPDGVKGAWDKNIAAIKSTSLFTLPQALAPNLQSSGSCPSWTMSANIGPYMNFGSGTISPPCEIWTGLRVFMIVCALILARRLIFGG